MAKTSPPEQITALRALIVKDIEDCGDIEAVLTPPAVQEVVLARRHLEDARMRLGVALAVVNGNDPLGQK